MFPSGPNLSLRNLLAITPHILYHKVRPAKIFHLDGYVGMAIIIDGYNVLHTSRWLRSSWKGLDRQRFCMLLAQLAQHRSEKVTVVFDALPSDSAPAFPAPAPVEVIYSGHSRTADDVMIRMVNDSTGPRDLTVVSSDHQIRTVAKRRGCKLVRAGEFIKSAAAELAQAHTRTPTEPDEKHKGLTSAQTRQWLIEFGLDPDQEDDPYEKMRR